MKFCGVSVRRSGTFSSFGMNPGTTFSGMEVLLMRISWYVRYPDFPMTMLHSCHDSVKVS